MTSRSSRGFTLAEVLLAVAILAFGLVSVMVARSRAVETAFVARNLKVARLLAEALLGEIESGLHEDSLEGASGGSGVAVDLVDRANVESMEGRLSGFEWEVFVGEESVAAAYEAKDDESLAGYYAEKEVRRREAEASGEELPPEPTTPVAVRVKFPTLGKEPGLFTLEARVETGAIDGKTDEEAQAEASAGAGTDGSSPPAGTTGGRAR